MSLQTLTIAYASQRRRRHRWTEGAWLSSWLSLKWVTLPLPSRRTVRPLPLHQAPPLLLHPPHQPPNPRDLRRRLPPTQQLWRMLPRQHPPARGMMVPPGPMSVPMTTACIFRPHLRTSPEVLHGNRQLSNREFRCRNRGLSASTAKEAKTSRKASRNGPLHLPNITDSFTKSFASRRIALPMRRSGRRSSAKSTRNGAARSMRTACPCIDRRELGVKTGLRSQDQRSRQHNNQRSNNSKVLSPVVDSSRDHRNKTPAVTASDKTNVAESSPNLNLNPTEHNKPRLPPLQVVVGERSGERDGKARMSEPHVMDPHHVMEQRPATPHHEATQHHEVLVIAHRVTAPPRQRSR
mmetsp:Transcript_66867/g.157771  ORF Transcript_66867/g.157771 Transcript_66867/m.157771 type:complete len:351 (+) Transcript_66867:300-1352(+)